MPAELARRSFLKASGIAGLSGLSALPRLPGGTTGTVGRSGSSRALSAAFFGLNGNNLQERLSWDRTDLDTALTALRPGTLRYPGGPIGNCLEWRSGCFQAGGPWPG